MVCIRRDWVQAMRRSVVGDRQVPGFGDANGKMHMRGPLSGKPVTDLILGALLA